MNPSSEWYQAVASITVGVLSAPSGLPVPRTQPESCVVCLPSRQTGYWFTHFVDEGTEAPRCPCTSQELAPHVPRFPFICMGVLISTSRRGGLGLRTSATVPAEPGKASRRCVQSPTCVHRQVCIRCRSHPSSRCSTPATAVRQPPHPLP